MIPLELLKQAKTITIKTGETISPPSNKSWLILYGAVNHVTGTASTTQFFEDKGGGTGNTIMVNIILTAEGSAKLPFYGFDNVPQYSQALENFVIHDTDAIKFLGGTDSWVKLRVVEF